MRKQRTLSKMDKTKEILKTIQNYIIDYATHGGWKAILIPIFLTIGIGTGIKYLEKDMDFLNYLSDKEENVRIFKKIGKEFKGNNIALIALKAKNNSDIFNPLTLSEVKKITNKVKTLKGITDVISITNVDEIKKIADGIEVSPLVPKNFNYKDKNQINKLKKKILSDSFYLDRLVSRDLKYTSIIIRPEESIDKEQIAKEIVQAVKELKIKSEYFKGGMPFQMEFMGIHIIKDMTYLIPLVILLVLLTLFYSFRTLRGVFLPLFIVLLTTIFTVGLMGFFGKKITMMTSILPVILIAIASAYGIHVINKINEVILESGKSKSRLEIIKLALKDVSIPIFLSAITTIVGFLSLTTATLTLVADFGLFSAIGVGYAIVLSLILLPH